MAASSAAPRAPIHGGEGSTRRLARWIADAHNDAMSPRSLEWARHATLDWLGVTLAGANEPLVRMLVDAYGTDRNDVSGAPVLFRDARRDGVLNAALINGSAGHALDFDDVSARMHGHPSAPVLPAVLALAQVRGSSGLDVLRAVIIGHEVQARIGEVMGFSHYARGFHATGTLGTFGAAAAAASLLGLNAEQCAHALGLAAAQAAGLKSMFGTMAKPFHAGKAAMNGLMAAQLAARGFTANVDALECVQGFGWTQADEPAALEPIDTGVGFAIEQTLFKYHAACYLTHSTIEAVRSLREQHDLRLDELELLQICVPAGHQSVCDIPAPSTGLHLKFSIRQLALMALDGLDTASLALYEDETATRPRYVAARARVQVQPTEMADNQAARVILRMRDGRRVEGTANVGHPATDTAAQWTRLSAKARAICIPQIGASRFERLHAQVEGLAHAESIISLMETLQ